MAEKTTAEEGSLVDVRVGTTVYDAEGNELGTVRGLDDAGFYVRSGEGTGRVAVEDARELFGGTYVMLRCWECGEMGEIEAGLPDTCPDCGAEREELYYWVED